MVARFTIKVDCCVTLYVLLLFFKSKRILPMPKKIFSVLRTRTRALKGLTLGGANW